MLSAKQLTVIVGSSACSAYKPVCLVIPNCRLVWVWQEARCD
jgi:hypothetical protein